MIFLRKLFLLTCDYSIKLLHKIRKLGSLTENDSEVVSRKFLKSSSFLPYDLVIPKGMGSAFKFTESIPEMGQLYPSGTVIGYEGLTPVGTPKKIRVAFFNTAETNVPEVKVFDPSELVLLFPTTDAVKAEESTSEALKEILDELKLNLSPADKEGVLNYGTETTDEDDDEDKIIH